MKSFTTKGELKTAISAAALPLPTGAASELTAADNQLAIYNELRLIRHVLQVGLQVDLDDETINEITARAG